MKLTIQQSVLKGALASVAPAVPARAAIPVLANLLLEADASGLTITATTLDLAIRVHVAAEVGTPGRVTVPAKKITDFVRELGDGPIALSDASGRLSLKQGKSTVGLNTLPAEDFPALPPVDFAAGWSIQGSTLQDLIASTAFAVATDESRPILAGVLWQRQGTEVRMVATDGHRLARRIVSVETPGTGEMIVPPKALAQVRRLVSGASTVAVASSGSYAGFRQGEMTVITRLIEGPYPNYEQVIPKTSDKRMTVVRTALEQVLRQMAVVASDQTRRLKLEVSGTTARFSVQTPDLGEADSEMTVEYQGEPIAIGFNVGYLLEVLGAMGTERVALSFTAPERAVTVEPVVDGGESPKFLCLVMPLRLTA